MNASEKPSFLSDLLLENNLFKLKTS